MAPKFEDMWMVAIEQGGHGCSRSRSVNETIDSMTETGVIFLVVDWFPGEKWLRNTDTMAINS